MNTAILQSIYKINEEEKGNNLDSNIFTNFKNNTTKSANGSLKFKTTGDIFLDDFAAASNYLCRPLEEVINTVEKEFKKDSLFSIKLAFYLRTITREPKNFDTKYQKHIGTGLKNEFICRMLYFSDINKNALNYNLWLIPLLGSYKDIIELFRYDLYYNGKPHSVDWDFVIKELLTFPNPDLFFKYAPSIKNKKKCTTLKQQANNYIGKWLAKKFFGKKFKDDKIALYRFYNKFKSQHAATSWQKCISEQNYDLINFNLVPGRALNKMSSTNFLANHGLISKFESFMEEKPVLNFTGFPFELFKSKVVYNYQKKAINKQFMQLVKNSSIDKESKFITCIDVSGSMSGVIMGKIGISAESVARSLALLFSYSLNGPFKHTYLTFEDTVTIREFVYDNYWNAGKYSCGITNFLAVADCLCSLKQSGNREEDFPTGVICISDGEFNRGINTFESNFMEFKSRLLNAGFTKDFVKNFKLILWDIPNNFYSSRHVNKYEGSKDSEYFFYLSGFDGGVLSFIFNTDVYQQAPKTPKELFDTAMNQELLNKIKI